MIKKSSYIKIVTAFAIITSKRALISFIYLFHFSLLSSHLPTTEVAKAFPKTFVALLNISQK